MAVVFGREGARWEWRTFSEREDFRGLFAEMHSEREVESAEVYFLREGSDANVKMRWGRLEVKIREKVSREGLEQWSLAIREEFPVRPAAVEHLYAVWKEDGPAVRGNLDEAAFAELTGRIGHVSAVRVHKQRHGYALLGGTAERALVEIEGSRYFTAAVEHESEEGARAMVAKLGMRGRENINYVRGLKLLAGAE